MKIHKSLFWAVCIIAFFPCFSYAQAPSPRTTLKGSKHNSRVVSTEKERNNPGFEDSIIITTHTWKQYKFIDIGTPDDKGRYSHDYEAYKVINGQSIRIGNKEIFNSRLKQLEKRINASIAADLKGYREDQESVWCLTDVSEPRFSINDMGISFDETGLMQFNVTFGLPSACRSVDGTTVSFQIADIGRYVK